MYNTEGPWRSTHRGGSLKDPDLNPDPVVSWWVTSNTLEIRKENADKITYFLFSLY